MLSLVESVVPLTLVLFALVSAVVFFTNLGKMEDILKVLTDGKADAALAASVFHYGDFTSEEVKKYLEKRD